VGAAFDLLEGFVDQPLVVFPGEVALDDLRGDHHGEVDRLAPNLLERPAGLELNLTLRVLDDVVGFGARLRADLFPEPIAVDPTLRDDAFRLDARLLDDPR